MKRFADVSIGRKLTVAMMATTTIALLVAAGVLGAWEIASSRRALVQRMETLADLVGRGSTATLLFSDATAQHETLAAAAAEPALLAAAVYRPDGSRLDAYARTAQHPVPPLLPPALATGYVEGALVVVHPVTYDGEHAGTVVLWCDTSEIGRRLVVVATVVGLAMLGAGAVGLLLAGTLQRLVAGPIVELASTARLVTADRNFAVRATRTTGDEVGRLVDDFNRMLADIERQDLELRRHRDGLQAEVEARTAELTEVNAQLSQALDRAQEASRVKMQFMANMSHEIRTPMNGILGITDLLLDTPLSAAQRQYLDLVRASTGGLLSVINDVLDFSKMEVAKLRLLPVDFELRPLIEEIAGHWRVRAQVKDLQFSCTIADEVPAWLHGDPARLRQILLNLLGNALKFTDTGGVGLDVALESSDVGDVRVAFAVSDTGPGIAPDDQQRIFEAFAQGDGSLTRRHGGTGLGLSISTELATMMGGRIALHSEPGAGSTFTATLRFGMGKEPALVEHRPPRGAPPQARYRVLVAEDNAVNQLVVRRALEKRGHAVTVVDNGQLAVQETASAAYDVLLLDLQMPVMDGFAAASAIRAREAETGGHLPIVALTAHALASDRDACREAGMEGFASKPVEAAALVDEIARAVAQARATPDTSAA